MRRQRYFFYGIFICAIIWCILFQLQFLDVILEFITSLVTTFNASAHIEKFFQQTPDLRDRLLLIDRRMLAIHFEQRKAKKMPCLFCNVERYQPVTFGLVTPVNKSLEENILLPVLRAWEAGFWVEQLIYSKYDRFSTLRPNLPLGFVLQKGGGSIVIEVVLLHQREGDFWWHGSLELDASYNDKLKNLKISDGGQGLALANKGAYDKVRFETVLIDGLDINIPRDIRSFLATPTTFVECDHERADKFHRLYGRDVSTRANVFRHRARKLLSTAKAILDSLKIRFWISSGTCLGYYRQCDVIPYSQDVDIGVFIKDYNASIINVFTSRGLRLKHKFGRVSDGLELSFSYRSVKLDIFFFYETSSYMWNGGHSIVYQNGQINSGIKYRYKFQKFTLCWTEFLEMKVRIPCETESYIRANYGPDWFRPVAKWHWAKDPYNVERVGVWRPDEVPEVLQVF